jgi:hypothetical protein
MLDHEPRRFSIAVIVPRGSRDDPIIGPGGTGPTSPRRGPVLPRPRTPEDDPAHSIVESPAQTAVLPVAEPIAPASPADASPAPLPVLVPTATEIYETATPFLELLEDVLAGGSLMGRKQPRLRARARRWLLPVGTSGEPLILFCGWAFALAIALAAYADFGPFAGPGDALLMLGAEAVLTIVVLATLTLAKARRRARVARAGDKVASIHPDDRVQPTS